MPFRTACLIFFAFAAAGWAEEPLKLTLWQANARRGPELIAAFAGDTIAVEGTVSAIGLRVLSDFDVPIQDNAGHGLMLEGDPAVLGALRPGDVVAVTGLLAQRNGMPVLSPSKLQVLRRVTPPEPAFVSLREAISPLALSRLVTIEARVEHVGENSGGEYVQLGQDREQIKVFLPRAEHVPSDLSLVQFKTGDTVRVTGITFQYCPNPPYSRQFELLVAHPSAMVLVARSWIIPPGVLLFALLGAAAGLVAWWFRERRMARQQSELQALHSLGEDVTGTQTPHEIVEKVAPGLAELTGAAVLVLYRIDSAGERLEPLASRGIEDPVPVSLTSPQGPLAQGAVTCWRRQLVCEVPDTRFNGLFRGDLDPTQPRSVFYLPLFAQQELVGVLQATREEKARPFSHHLRSALQHLANQMAISLRLQEQQSIREQLFRSEKLAAVGQLIAGVAEDLRTPLTSISVTAERLLHMDRIPEHDLTALASDARRAAATVTRLVSFTTQETGASRTIDLNRLLADLLTFRLPECHLHGIEVIPSFAARMLPVNGLEGQLEQVFLNLLIHAEQSLKDAPERRLTIDTTPLGARVIVTICYTSQEPETALVDPFHIRHAGQALGLDVCRAIILSHNGGIRLLRTSGDDTSFEVELPLAESVPETRPAVQPLSILTVEPDAPEQERLLLALGGDTHRIIPTMSADEAVQLATRMKFDVALCATSLRDTPWTQLLERLRPLVGSVAILVDGWDPSLAAAVHGRGGQILVRPVYRGDVERLTTGRAVGKPA